MLPFARLNLRLALLSLRHKSQSTLSAALLLGAVAACGLATADNLSPNPGGTIGGGNGAVGGGGGDGQGVPLPDAALPKDAIRVAGTFGPAAVMRLARSNHLGAGAPVRAAEAMRTLYVLCTVHDATLQQSRGALDADGDFSVVVLGARDKLMGCSLVDDSNALLANLTFQGGHDLTGNAAASHEVALSTHVDLGRIYYDETTYEAAVNGDHIATARSTAATAAKALDISGSWKVATPDFPLPADAVAPCNEGEAACGRGLVAGTTLRALQLSGRRTDTGTDAFAAQVWDAPAQLDACGARLGRTAAEQAAADVDFSAAGAASDAFTYSQSVTFTDAEGGGSVTSQVVDGYRLKDVAKAATDDYGCVGKAMGDGAVVQVCGPDANTTFRAASAKGCRNLQSGRSTTDVPAASDWTQPDSSCTSEGTANNLQSYTCTLTLAASGEKVSCAALQGDFTDAGLAVPTSAGSPTNSAVGRGPLLLAAGAACSLADPNTAAGLAAQRRCDAAYLARSGAEDADGACLIQTVYNGADVDAPLAQDYRPKHLRHADLFVPLADGSGGTLTTRWREMRSTMAGTPGMGAVPVTCLVVVTRSLNLVKINEGRLLATYVEQRGTDDLRPACLAAFTDGAVRTVAYLDKM